MVMRPEINMSRKFRILVVDECPVVCAGLTELIEEEPDLSIYWHGQSYVQALHHIRTGRPDLVIAGERIERISTSYLINEMRAEASKVLVYGSCLGGAHSKHFLSLGADAYVCKSEPMVVLLTAIRLVLKGKTYTSPGNMEKQKLVTFGTKSHNQATPFSSLGKRELEIYRLIGTGKTSVEIAKELGLSLKTVETYRSKIKEKLSLRNNTELLQTAFFWLQMIN